MSKRLLLGILVSLLIGCGSSGGGGGQPPEPKPPVPPPPIVCEEGYRLLDGECVPIPPPPVITLRVCLEWDAVIHPDLAGYTIYYGKVSNQYDFNVEVAEPYTEVCIEDESYFIEGGSYYFVATATSTYDEESENSNEVLWEPQ